MAEEVATEKEELVSSDNNNNTNNTSKVYNIIHFSDVYDICDDKFDDNKGGASRFLSALNIFANELLDPLIFFSGDFISPNNISCITNGEHMIDIMNKFGIKCGILGNHDFDFGENNMYKIIKSLQFPIINTNLLFNSLPIIESNKNEMDSNHPLIRKYFIINYSNDDDKGKGKGKTLEIMDNIDIENKDDEKQNDNDNDNDNDNKHKLKIGVIGICENWLSLIEDRLDNKNNIIYQDMIESTQKYIIELRENHKVDMIIALTHNKLLNDRVLADKINGIDLILGGHDHINICSMTKNTRTLIVKSGYNFKNFSWIQFMAPPQHIQFNENNKNKKVDIIDNLHSQNVKNALNECLLDEKGIFKARKYWYRVRYYQVNKTLKYDLKMKELVDCTINEHENKLNKIVGQIECNLDCTEFSLLNGECNSANFVLDIIRISYKCDCVIISATSFLSDDDIEITDNKMSDDFLGGPSTSNFNIDGTINKGGITYRDIMNKLYTDKSAIILLQLTGSQIHAAIEHGLSKKVSTDSDNDNDNDNYNGNSNELINGVTKFPHVSGLRFVYDPIQMNGKKIKTIWIMRYNENGNEQYVELQDNQIYSVATSHYLANGGDGYGIFQDPVSIIRDDEESINGHMILIDFFKKINNLNNMKLLNSNNNNNKQKINKKEILSEINKLSLKSKGLSSCIETKWVSSFQVLSRSNSNKDDIKSNNNNNNNNNGDVDDDDDEDDILRSNSNVIPITPRDIDDINIVGIDDIDKNDKNNKNDKDNKKNENDLDVIDNKKEDINIPISPTTDDEVELGNNQNDEIDYGTIGGSEDSSNIELGGGAINNEDNDDNQDKERKDNENEEEDDVELHHTEKQSLRDKIKQIDKTAMKNRFNLIKKTSVVKLNIMSEKLKKIAKESQDEIGKLSEKAKHFIHIKDRDIKYDLDGNILDVEIFIIKPKIDNRIMTVDDEKRWLKLKTESNHNLLFDINNFEDDNDIKQRQKISEEIDDDQQNNNNNNKKNKAKLFVSRSSEILKKIEFKKPQFNRKVKGAKTIPTSPGSGSGTATNNSNDNQHNNNNIDNNNNNNDNNNNKTDDVQNNKKKKRFQFKGFRK